MSNNKYRPIVLKNTYDLTKPKNTHFTKPKNSHDLTRSKNTRYLSTAKKNTIILVQLKITHKNIHCLLTNQISRKLNHLKQRKEHLKF